MTTKTQDENIVKWLAALRSGEYEQGVGNLFQRNGEHLECKNGYCCLGVAGRVLDIPDDILSGDKFRAGEGAYDQIQKEFGLQDSLGVYKKGALYLLNDVEGWDFNQIADLIESRPEGLFVD